MLIIVLSGRCPPDGRGQFSFAFGRVGAYNLVVEGEPWAL